MAVFKYKLSSLLRLKSQLEDQAKNRFGIAVAEFNAEMSRLNRINAVISETVDEFRTLNGGRFIAGRIKDYNYFLSAMKERASAQKNVVAHASVKMDEAREALILAMRQREMYGKLKEKAHDRYLADERRAEHRAADELATYRAGAGTH